VIDIMSKNNTPKLKLSDVIFIADLEKYVGSCIIPSFEDNKVFQI